MKDYYDVKIWVCSGCGKPDRCQNLFCICSHSVVQILKKDRKRNCNSEYCDVCDDVFVKKFTTSEDLLPDD